MFRWRNMKEQVEAAHYKRRKFRSVEFKMNFFHEGKTPFSIHNVRCTFHSAGIAWQMLTDRT